MEAFEIINTRDHTFTGKFLERLDDGSLLHISAYVPKIAERFTINFYIDNNKAQIALQICASFSKTCIIGRNSYLHGKWGKADTNEILSLIRGKELEVDISVTVDNYIVIIDQYQCFRFKHRAPYREISGLLIYGDIEVTSISYGKSFYVVTPVCYCKVETTAHRKSEECEKIVSCKHCKLKLKSDQNCIAICKFCTIHEEMAKTGTLNEIHLTARDGLLQKTCNLLKSGVDIDSKTSENGITPLFLAILENRLDMVNFLMLCNADVNHRAISGFTALHLAAQRGDVEVARLLLSAGAVINAKTFEHITPLHYAVQSGSLEIVKLLIAHKACVNVITKDCMTPLHLASLYGHSDIVNVLIQQNADLNAVAKIHYGKYSAQNVTPIHVAIQGRHINIVHKLIEAGANLYANTLCENSPLHLAAMVGSLDIVNLLLKANVDVNCKNALSRTPLLTAVLLYQPEIVKRLLLVKGIEIECKNVLMMTPLNMAASMGYYKIVKELVDHKANIETKNVDSWTPLHHALNHNWTAIAELLISNGADVNARQFEKWTPIHLAAANGCPVKLIRMLVEKGANLNVRKENGIRPLHLAVKGNHFEIVEFLIKRGANITAVDNYGLNALHHAVGQGCLHVAKVLCERDIDINARDTKRGYAPLHYAIHSTSLPTVQFLLLKDAYINITDNNNQTPLYLAAKFGHNSIVEQLLKRGANTSIKEVPTGNSPLHISVEHGHIECAKLLITHGANVNDKTTSGNTLLKLCAKRGDGKLLKLFLENGAYFDYQALKKCTVNIDNANVKKNIDKFLDLSEKLLNAVMQGDETVLSKCLKKGAIVDFRNVNTTPPLLLATQNNSVNILKILLKHGANVNITDAKHFTSLHYASKLNHSEIVCILLTNGAIFDTVNSDKKLPIELVTNKDITSLLQTVSKLFKDTQSGSDEIVDKLIAIKDKSVTEFMSIINARNSQKQTLVQVALCNQHKELAKSLLKLIQNQVV